MTVKAWYHSDELALKTDVLSCTENDNAQFYVILAATLFHPQGGGQPSDRGTIGGIELLKASQQGGEIIHLTASRVPLGAVDIRVDTGTRQRHTRLHSAGHLISVVAEKFGWQAIKGDHRPGSGRIVFSASEQSRTVEMGLLQQLTTQLVAADLPRKLSEKNGIRTVTWGDLPDYACGGTHVQFTGQVGEVIISSAKEKKGQLSVQYDVVG